MQNNKTKEISFAPDRMGRFIGQLRVHEGITLSQLSHGLCSVPFLNRIENGEREIGKQMTDAFFQRLGKPVELFERILDWDEFQRWNKRQKIISHLNKGDISSARIGIAEYSKDGLSGVLDQQFLQIVELNCCALAGATSTELLSMVDAALKLTQPAFDVVPVDAMLLSQNEGWLFFSHLKLREKIESYSSVAEDYRALLRYFKQSRYESRERVYLLPYIALHVIENDYKSGYYRSALDLCESTIAELTNAKRLFAFDQLLAWKQRLFDATGNPDHTPMKLLAHLNNIKTGALESVDLLVPCSEGGHVYCLNQVIRDRRKLLGISQEELSADVCSPHTLSRIENQGGKLHRKNRKMLLQRVNMSGERYDYEIVTDSYEAYLLRSELDRATTAKDWGRVQTLFTTLKQKTPDTPTNRQYFLKKEYGIKAALPEGHPERITLEERVMWLRDTISLTLPLDIDTIDLWASCVLSINEILSFLTLANCYEKLKNYEQGLSILSYVKRCLENSGADASFYEDLYIGIGANTASILGELGRYQESNLIVSECLKLSVQNQRSAKLARLLFGAAWNLTRHSEELPQENRSDCEQHAIDLLRQAYAAAKISGDAVRQRAITAFCLREYNIEIAI